jgi:hypothetical protein
MVEKVGSSCGCGRDGSLVSALCFILCFGQPARLAFELAEKLQVDGEFKPGHFLVRAHISKPNVHILSITFKVGISVVVTCTHWP